MEAALATSAYCIVELIIRLRFNTQSKNDSGEYFQRYCVIFSSPGYMDSGLKLCYPETKIKKKVSMLGPGVSCLANLRINILHTVIVVR